MELDCVLDMLSGMGDGQIEFGFQLSSALGKKQKLSVSDMMFHNAL